ncbi:MAG: hypothetical protein ABJZ55_01390 [Fuerstiella sp.]
MLGAQTATGAETVETQTAIGGTALKCLQYLAEDDTPAQQKPDPLVLYLGLPWGYHVARDAVIPIEESRRLVDALKAVGPNVQFTVSPNAKHYAWTETYANLDVFAWMLGQQRRD